MDESILLLALADSVNPCTLGLMILLLAVLLGKKGRKDAVLGGILFIATIYIMYTLYGLGVLAFITTSGLYTILKYAVPLLVLLLALVELRAYLFYKPGLTSLEMPMMLRPIAKKFITTVSSPWIAVPVATLCSILLLPCSSGPYLTAIFLMRGIGDLLLYNLIFVFPMLLILLLFGLGVSPRKIQELREKYIREIHLVSGLLLLVVFFLVLPTPAQMNTVIEKNIFLVSSPTCPHCQHIEEVLRELNVIPIRITPEEGSVLAKERNVEWDGGVPLLIIGDKVLEGFPSKEQDINGFFPEEEDLCRSIGTPMYENNTYLYCKLKNGAILGNVHILRKLLAEVG